jgi:hypothetical protein
MYFSELLYRGFNVCAARGSGSGADVAEQGLHQDNHILIAHELVPPAFILQTQPAPAISRFTQFAMAFYGAKKCDSTVRKRERRGYFLSAALVPV